MENLGIELFTHRPQDPEIEQPQNTYVPQDTQPIPQLTQQFPILHGANEAFQLPEFDYFDRDMFQVNPEQLEIVSSIEPIAVTVGALNDPTTDMYEGG